MTTYVSPNYPSKKLLKEAIAAGKPISVFQAGMGTVPDNGPVYISGPHYPKPHKWYAEGTMVNGKLTKIK